MILSIVADQLTAFIASGCLYKANHVARATMSEILAQLFPHRICGRFEIPMSMFSFETTRVHVLRKKEFSWKREKAKS